MITSSCPSPDIARLRIALGKPPLAIGFVSLDGSTDLVGIDRIHPHDVGRMESASRLPRATITARVLRGNRIIDADWELRSDESGSCGLIVCEREAEHGVP